MLDKVINSLTSSFTEFFETAAAWIPKIATGILLFIGALFVAKIIARVFQVVLARIKIDSLSAKVGIRQMIDRMGVRSQLSELVPRVVYFLLLVLFTRTACDALGLTVISEAIGSFLGYLPNLGAAIVILVFGGTAAQFSGRIITQNAKNAGIDFASSLGNIVSGGIIFVIGVMAVGQLKLDTDIIRLLSAGILAGAALAFGLSFGLGTRDITRNMLAGFYARKVFRIGDTIEVKGETGTLRSITPTAVVLEQDTGTVTLSNRVFIEETIKKQIDRTAAGAS